MPGVFAFSFTSATLASVDMKSKINYGWVNAKYTYIFFELLIGGVAVYGIVRLLASLRAEK